ncbi:hypothetical protein [Patulibacter sp.]|uniref:hypothetical protein n=1 Tax=Patulibacter sp. TaxID=1912859 RepID=UPI00272C36ED|nr:hypothetical protein [Patulibacter sp.]
MTTAVIVAATGGIATVAVAAGPVVYSEYTTGGDRENRVVQEDGRGDVALPLDVAGAAVSPDGRRIAQTTVTTSAGGGSRFSTALRVTAGDGTGAVQVLEAGSDGRLAITGTPVWSPDSRQVLVQRTTLDDGDPVETTRVVCVVDTKACRDAGTVPLTGPSRTTGLLGDVVAWQATDGPIVRDGVRATALSQNVRCGARARTVKGPTVRLRGLTGSTFGGPLALRGLPGSDDDGDTVDPSTIGALAVAGGTLVVDAPAADIRRGALRCGTRGGSSISLRTSLGLSRVRLRAGGRTTSLPTPPGLRRGTALRLVGTDTGGAVLISAGAPGTSTDGYCSGPRKSRVRNCFSPLGSGRTGEAPVLRVWRYVDSPTPRFERVTTARRSALRTLEAASEFTVASGDAVLAVSDGAIERVPLDGGAPTTIARGRGLSLNVGAW